MKTIALISLLLFISNAHSFSFRSIFENDSLSIDRAIALQHLNLKDFESSLPKDKFETIVKDPKDRVLDNFTVTDFFRDSTHFWFNIYTIYDSQSVVLHDMKDLGLVYKAYNYEKIHNSDLNIQTKHALQNELTLQRVYKLKDALIGLSRGEDIPSYYEHLIKGRLKEAGMSIPSNSAKKRKFYLKRANNLRVQTGQKDNIQQGLVNYSAFSPVIDDYFEAFNVPEELLAISFLESSFNPRARSRVGATGVWQFMRFIGKHFMTINRHRDDRLHPLISTVSAFFLLKQNKQILDRWDLAIVAYNSGTKHLIKAKRQLDIPEFTLEDYLTKYEHPHVGFASQNFYSSFLALVYALNYKDHFFPSMEELQKQASDFDFSAKKLDVYVSKCPFTLGWFVDALKESSPDIRFLNRHLRYRSHQYPRGTILFSDVDLTTRRYVKVPVEEMPSHYPKNWGRFIRGQRCSTR